MMRDDSAGARITKKDAGGIAGGNTCGVKVLSRLLLISERRVQQLVDEGVITKVGHGRYDLESSVQGYVRYLQAGASNDQDIVDFQRENALLTKARREQAELDLAIARGEVAPVADMERTWARAFAELRTNICNVPGRVVRQLLGEKDERRFKAVLRAELVQALEATAQADPDEDDGEGDADE